MRIQVWNDGKSVFTGEASRFLTDNDGDDAVAEMISETEKTGHSVRDFMHSGKWEVRKAN